jgi:hypothetical protein
MRASMALLAGVSLVALAGCGPRPDDVTRADAGPGSSVLIGRKAPDGSGTAFITNPDGKMRECAVDRDGHLTICTAPV